MHIIFSSSKDACTPLSFLLFYEFCLTIDNALIKPSCYITQVETADDSEPLLSLLAPLGTGDYKSYWKGPENNTSVEFSIVLCGLSDVAGVAIIVSSCGYSTSDCPIVRLPSYFLFLHHVILILSIKSVRSMLARVH